MLPACRVCRQADASRAVEETACAPGDLVLISARCRFIALMLTHAAPVRADAARRQTRRTDRPRRSVIARRTRRLPLSAQTRSGFPAGRRVLHPATTARPAAPSMLEGRAPARRSFFMRLLRRCPARAHAPRPARSSAAPAACPRALVHLHPKCRRSRPAIPAPPAHHLMHIRFRPLTDPRRERGLLRRGQLAPRHAPARFVSLQARPRCSDAPSRVRSAGPSPPPAPPPSVRPSSTKASASIRRDAAASFSRAPHSKTCASRPVRAIAIVITDPPAPAEIQTRRSPQLTFESVKPAPGIRLLDLLAGHHDRGLPATLNPPSRTPSASPASASSPLCCHACCCPWP